jgi:hypothetical protein
MRPDDPKQLHPVIDPVLAAIARSSPAMPSWYDAWSRLGPGSTHEERLQVCQAIRDSGTVPDEAGYFLVSWAAEYVAEEEDARHLDPLAMLNAFECIRGSERTFAAQLERHGEGRMVALFRTDPDEHDRLREAGRQFFFGPEGAKKARDPRWVQRLVRAVADSMEAGEPVGSLRFRHRKEGDIWLVHVCPTAGQGDALTPGWAVDIERLREMFERIDSQGWYAVPREEGEGPYLWAEGKFGARKVFLRILAAAEADKDCEVWRRWMP